VLNTLERLRQTARQQEPPRARPNSPAGGAPGGGDPTATDTANLTESQRGAIGAHVRECWTADSAALNAQQLVVMLTVTTDARGVVRRADVAPTDQGRMSDPRFRAFAERAIRAVLDSRCAALPLPRGMLGQTRTWDFRFRP
jgi:hypothetical protein